MKLLSTVICVGVAYLPAAFALLGEIELSPHSMVAWAATWCGLAGAASAAREGHGFDVIARTALYMAIAGPAVMWGSYYWHADDPRLGWSVLGVVVFLSLGGYSMIDFGHNLLRRLGTAKLEQFTDIDEETDID